LYVSTSLGVKYTLALRLLMNADLMCVYVSYCLFLMLSILSVLYYDAKLFDIGRWCPRIALELWMQEKKWRSKHSNYL